MKEIGVMALVCAQSIWTYVNECHKLGQFVVLYNAKPLVIFLTLGGALGQAKICSCREF
jgi:hypothetical protein